MGNLVEYQDYTESDASADISDIERTPFFKFTKGANLVRFVPARKGEENFFKTYNHFLGDEVNGLGVNCPRRMTKGRQKCPICAVAKSLSETGDKDDEERSKKLNARRRVYAAVIDRNNPDAGVQIVAFGAMIHEDLARIRKDAIAGGDFMNPESGFDFSIEKTGEKLKTRYKVRRVPERTPLAGSTDDMNELISTQPDKRKHGQLMEYAAIVEVSAEWVPEYSAMGITTGPALTGGSSDKALPSGPTASDDLEEPPDDNVPY
jgi:hypothetical protein